MKNDTDRFNETWTSLSDGSESTNLIAQVATGMGLYCLALLTCIGNAMVIHAIRTEKRLKTVSNLFIMSLAVADLMVGAFVMPISAIYAVTNGWYLGVWLCEIWLSIDYTASTASIFNLFVLSTDRYWSITSPLKYLRQRTKRRALLLITSAWSLSSLWILPVTTWHRIVNSGNRQLPTNACDVEFAHNVPFKVTAAVVNFYIPTLAMLYIYVRIFYTIRRRSRSQNLGVVSHGSSSNSNMVRTTCPTTRGSATAARDRRQLTEDPGPPPAATKINLQRSKNGAGDDSSDSLSSEAEDQHEKSVSHCLRNRFRRLLSKPYSHCQPENALVATHHPSSNDYLFTNGGDQLRGERRRSFTYYESLTLLDARTLDKRGETSSRVTRYDNVRVNVEYVREQEEDEEEDNGANNPISGQPEVQVSQGTSGSANQYVRVGGGCRPVVETNNSSSTTLSSALISQKERKAARQLGVIMCAFIVCWLPYFIVFLVVAVCPTCISRTLQNITLWLGYANSTLNPCLYPLCNRNFRRAFSKMARCCPISKTKKHQTYPLVRRDIPWHNRY